jgi:hypothetical protein
MLTIAGGVILGGLGLFLIFIVACMCAPRNY